MTLTGLHLLLTYRCNSTCDHCFVWGSPEQEGVFTLAAVRELLRQARELGSIEWVYFEGGEPFLFQPILVAGAKEAADLGFHVGVVTNGYWATEVEDAAAWLRPMAGLVEDLTVSTDLFHYNERISPQARHAQAAAEQLGIPVSTIICEVPEALAGSPAQPRGEPVSSGAIMFRGRAAAELAPKVALHPWTEMRECPHERLDDPGRVHVDPLGFVHLCQGLAMGNLWHEPLPALVSSYRPREHPIIGPLLEGGPAALVEEFNLDHEAAYADACHLCYAARAALRPRFGDVLAPGQMYGERPT
jgi:hypothetical protein